MAMSPQQQMEHLHATLLDVVDGVKDFKDGQAELQARMHALEQSFLADNPSQASATVPPAMCPARSSVFWTSPLHSHR